MKEAYLSLKPRPVCWPGPLHVEITDPASKGPAMTEPPSDNEVQAFEQMEQEEERHHFLNLHLHHQLM